jgi:hypothetical protein
MAMVGQLINSPLAAYAGKDHEAWQEKAKWNDMCSTAAAKGGRVQRAYKRMAWLGSSGSGWNRCKGIG